MEQWYCFKCKEKMKETEVTLSYMGVEMPGAEGIKCPNCGVKYLLEKFTIEQVREGEKLMETK